MKATEIGNQVKGILDGSAAKLKDLKGKGLQVADEAVAKAKATAAQGQDALAKGRIAFEKKGQKAIKKGQKTLHDLLGEIKLHDLMARYGHLSVPEAITKIKASDLAKHTESVRAEILGFLKVPQAEQVTRLEIAVEKMAKDVAGLKTLKADVKKLDEQVKDAKAAAKAAAKPVAAPKPAPKAPGRPAKKA